MKGSFLIIALLLFFGGYAMKVALADASSHRRSEAQVSAENLIVFSGLVRDFKKKGSNIPSGVTSGAGIPSPSWFKSSNSFFVFSHSSSEYVYSVHNSAPEAAKALEALDVTARWDDEALLVGRSEGGFLYTLRAAGAPPTRLPAGIPDNAVVVPITMP